MGYNTSFEIGLEGPEPVNANWRKEVAETLAEISPGYGLAFEPHNRGNAILRSVDSMKWYDCQGDMIELSLRFPNLCLTLSGEGEEAGDVWRGYYLNGKSHVVKPEIIFPSFEEIKDKLN